MRGEAFCTVMISAMKIRMSSIMCTLCHMTTVALSCCICLFDSSRYVYTYVCQKSNAAEIYIITCLFCTVCCVSCMHNVTCNDEVAAGIRMSDVVLPARPVVAHGYIKSS